MKIEKPRIAALAIAGFVLGVILLRECGRNASKAGTRDTKPIQEQSSPSHAEAEKGILDRISSAYKNPITLFGKVVDQHGDPVEGASIELYPLTSHFGKDTSKSIALVSDAEGAFSITGLEGFSMGVSVKKEGYLRYPPTSALASEATLHYGVNGDGRRHASPDNPLIMELHKVGFSETLVRVNRKRWKLPIDGTTQIISLDSKEGEGTHQLEFSFASGWSQLPMDNEINSKLFDWSLEVRIPGGGLVWDRSDANFEAPADGYREFIRYDYRADMPREEWKRIRFGRYFVKFPDGTYARINFDIDGGSDRSPLYMESWLNPKPGSRNFATDTMSIKVLDMEEPRD